MRCIEASAFDAVAADQLVAAQHVQLNRLEEVMGSSGKGQQHLLPLDPRARTAP